jgi:2'-5' RNA ligase
MLMEHINILAGLHTDYDLCEYLLVAHPNEEVNEKVMTEKRNFTSNHDYTLAKETKPHITIANFLAKEEMEETLIRWIQNICNLNTSFSVTLNNFSSFSPHTIYLRVQDHDPFKKLANALKILDGFIQSNDCPPLRLVNKPHLTIARGLPESIYEDAIKEYAQRSFHESFKVDKLFLLKRDVFMKCHLINTFVLPPPLTLFD